MEIVSRMLKRAGIAHETLNAKNHAREGHIVTQAGRLGAVTISTNMAGRGTDIKLGGNAEEWPRIWSIPRRIRWLRGEARELKVQCAAEREQVLAAGGLRIVGTERHESRRIDNQLRGRAGRQETWAFPVYLEDDLLKIFGSTKIWPLWSVGGTPKKSPLSTASSLVRLKMHRRRSRATTSTSKNLLEYDDVLNAQRQAVYDLRRAPMGENVREMMLESIEGVTTTSWTTRVP